ncbi:hypothetical protein HPB48_015072 [Haemaphysalis longicornis]|uniref:Endonuclease/exonuclease/phosphatase domain-containing protein n=1 Tax=Haemaphysalis longicornis TaxID=44386 RepID=A0A9J6GTC1_HAELO|nr:hypothetical protein HPB48_015072 [Haemaphysalis longicornis]
MKRPIKQGHMTTHYTFADIIPSKQRKGNLFPLNVYSNPKHIRQNFRSHLHQASTSAISSALEIGGDFNARHTASGYVRDTSKSRNLL